MIPTRMTLKSKLYAIVLVSFVVRVVAFFLLPNTASRLAPDEGTYAELAEVVAKGMPVDEAQFGEQLYLISRAFTIPASFLVRLGFSGLDSIRLIASLYGLLTFILVITTLLRLSESRKEVESFMSNNQNKVLTLLIIFALLPSHLIWSILGLREAALEFWILLVFTLIFYVFEVKKSPSKGSSLGILLAIPLVFSSRPQVGWVLGVTLFIYFLVRVKDKAANLLIPITVIGVFLGYAATTAFSIETTETFVAHSQSASVSPPSPQIATSTPIKGASKKPSKNQQATSSPTATSQAEFIASSLCKSEGQEVTFDEVKYLCNKVEAKSIVGLKNPGIEIVDRVDAIPAQQEANKLDAASAIETQACPITDSSRFAKYFCIAYRAPYTTFTFLFRPLLGPDITSSSSLFAALENVFWLAAFIFVLVMFVRNRRLAFFKALAPSLLFFFIYSVGAGAYEGNMGTAFRHKSLILWVVILLLASTIVATKERKAEN